MPVMLRWTVPAAIAVVAGALVAAPCAGQATPDRTDALAAPPRDVLTPDRRAAVDAAVDRALSWLATQQQADGSFRGPEEAEPGITALCVMAFLSRGHRPGRGQYGPALQRAVDFSLACQRKDGLICHLEPEATHTSHSTSHCATYSHAIAALMLCQVYGQAEDPAAARRMAGVIERAVEWSLRHQRITKRRAHDRGGWRYLRRRNDESDSDLSVTSWQMMFLRAARNVGFTVPDKAIDDALVYVKACGKFPDGTFHYGLGYPNKLSVTQAQAGMGIVSLAMAGELDSPLARSAAGWLRRQNLHQYNAPFTAWTDYNPYHYSTFYASLAMYQLGGDYWQTYYPKMVETLLSNQKADGSWHREIGGQAKFGNWHTTAFAVMALTTPYQLLPITQR